MAIYPASMWNNDCIRYALDRAFEQIVKRVDDGYTTRDAVRHGIGRDWGDAVAEAWDLFCEEWDE